MLKSRQMTYIFISIIVLLSLCIVWLSINYRHTRRKYDSKVGELNLMIVALNEIAERQSGQLRLSDELHEKIILAGSIIHEQFFETGLIIPDPGIERVPGMRPGGDRHPAPVFQARAVVLDQGDS